MKFTKMQGAGNDFIVINNMIEKIPQSQLSSLAADLCRRRISIGADGLMVVEAPDAGGDYKMLFFNGDGSVGEMCGNGARCIACYGYENGLAGDTQRIETTAGMVIGRRISERYYQIRLNDLSVMELERRVTAEGRDVSVDYIEVGNPGLPHGVVEMKGLSEADQTDLKQLGRALRYQEDFPKGMNVNFYEVVGCDEVCELTYERGVEDFTLACGTGTGSVVAALTRKGLVSGKHVKVHVPGGQLFIDIADPKQPEKDIYLTGPVKIVAEGVLCDK